MSKAFDAHDFETQARRYLPKMVYDFVAGGAGDEVGIDANAEALRTWKFLPQRLHDVSHRDLTARLWDRTYKLPVYITPTGMNGILRHDADAMLARAAARAGIPFALSTASTQSIEEIARAGDGEKWFQLYVMGQAIADSLCQRAQAAGYSTLILTADVPLNGYRERDMRDNFGLPLHITPRTIWDGMTHPLWSLRFVAHGIPKLGNFQSDSAQSTEMQAAVMNRQMDASFDWTALARLRDLWKDKLIVKGLLRKDDAQRCAQMGIDAVILSTHGGRQLDDAMPPMAVLPEVVDGLGIPVLIDSGIRRGTDVVKALCLGASMTGIGRPALYAVAAHGEEGVDALIAILRDEMDRGLALVGATDLPGLDASLMRRI